MLVDVRKDICDNALWGASHEPQIHYTEGSTRMMAVHHPRLLPMDADCSAFVTDCYSWAGAPDPNGFGYNGSGYTGTLIAHNKQITLPEVGLADLCIFGPGNGDHVSLILEAGSNPRVVSHGSEGGPRIIRLFDDTRSKRYYRCMTTKVIADPPVPVLPPAKGSPKPSDLAAAHLVALANPADAHQAKVNGYALYYWSEGHHPNPFCPQVNGHPAGVTLYASVNWRKPK